MHNPFRKSRLIYSAAVLLMKDRKVEDFMPLSSVKAVGLLATWSEVSGSFAVLPFRTPVAYSMPINGKSAILSTSVLDMTAGHNSQRERAARFTGGMNSSCTLMLAERSLPHGPKCIGLLQVYVPMTCRRAMFHNKQSAAIGCRHRTWNLRAETSTGVGRSTVEPRDGAAASRGYTDVASTRMCEVRLEQLA